MATVISAIALSIIFFIFNLNNNPAFADLVYEDGYTVSTIFDGNKLEIYPHSVNPKPGSSDLFLLDSKKSAVYTVSIPDSGEVSLVRLAGNGTADYSDGDPSFAMFRNPKSFAVDARGNLYVADPKNKHAIRKISKSGVTTIAGGFSDKAGNKDGSGRNATFSDDYELVFVPRRCALIITDFGNNLVRQINLKAEDCSRDSQSGSGLGSTTAWFLGLVISCIFGLIVGFVLRPYVVPIGGSSRHPSRNETWKHCLMSLGRQVLMLYSELRSVVVNSSAPYSLLKRIIYLSFSHLSLIFTMLFIRRIEPRKPPQNPPSLLDIDDLTGIESTKKHPRMLEAKDVPLLDFDDTSNISSSSSSSSSSSKSVNPEVLADELMDLVPVDEGFLSNAESILEKENKAEKNNGSNGKIDGMIEANLFEFAGCEASTSAVEFLKSSLGLVAKRRMK